METVLRLAGVAVAAIFWMVVGGLTLFLLVLAMAVMGFLFGPLFTFGGPVGALLLLIMLGIAARRTRQRRAMLVLGQIEQAVRLNLPLPAMLSAAAASEDGIARQRLDRLQRAIESGLPVGEAVSTTVPELSRRTVALIEAGERVGQLPATLARLAEADRRERSMSGGPDAMFSWAYGMILVLVLMITLGGVSIFIMPKFAYIFEDFEVALPWITEFTMTTFASVARWLLPLAAVGVLAVAGRSVWHLLHMPDRRPAAWGPVTDRLLWVLPGLHGLVRDRGLADAFELVADALRAGVPLEQALMEAGELPVNAVLRGRLVEMAGEVAAGREPGEAARTARLPAVVSGMLGPATSGGGDAVRTFAFLGRYYRLRFSKLAELGRAAVLPAIVLVSALLVGFVVLAMFLPLIELIDSATNEALTGGRL
ncbi:MAG: type II secretion system F family protein [Phycisphaeraceae bacterium]